MNLNMCPFHWCLMCRCCAESIHHMDKTNIRLDGFTCEHAKSNNNNNKHTTTMFVSHPCFPATAPAVATVAGSWTPVELIVSTARTMARSFYVNLRDGWWCHGHGHVSIGHCVGFQFSHSQHGCISLVFFFRVRVVLWLTHHCSLFVDVCSFWPRGECRWFLSALLLLYFDSRKIKRKLFVRNVIWKHIIIVRKWICKTIYLLWSLFYRRVTHQTASSQNAKTNKEKLRANDE